MFEVNGPILSAVTASEKDRLQLYEWRFPLIGKVTYKGFFTKKDALREQRFLEKKELDTFVYGVDAYSTLGWLKDPIFSSILKWNEATLANLILHEMTHPTVYFKGKTDLNEQIATFVGNQGAIHFLTEKFGPGSKEVNEAIYMQEDDFLFSYWLDQACQRLTRFYAEKISREEKLKGREEIFKSIQEEFRRIQTQFRTDQYKGFDKLDLNNAVLLAYRRYLHRLKKFETLYEHMGRDLRQVVEFFKKIQVSGDEKGLASFLE
jgi:predicted aminopeptidase